MTLKPAPKIDAQSCLKKLLFDFNVIYTKRTKQKFINIFCIKKLSI